MSRFFSCPCHMTSRRHFLAEGVTLVGGITATVFLPGPIQAQPSCPTPRAARVHLQVLDPDPLVNSTQSIRWLSDRLQRNARSWQRDPRLDRFIHAMGLTLIEWGSELSIAGLSGLQGTQHCFVATDLRVRFGLHAHLVFIAREVPRGSCLWRDIHSHEMRHVAVNRSALRAAVTQLSTDLEHLGHQGISTQGRTLEAAQQAAFHRLTTVIRRSEDIFYQRSTRGHAAIDTPEEYERASRACGGEAQQILRNIRT